MNNKCPYIRVATTYFKKTKKPLLSGDFAETLTKWSLDTIKQDYGHNWKEIFEQIPKYDGFCNIPSHINYQRTYEGFYNQYEPLIVEPKEGQFECIYKFLSHIFEEHMDLAIDYLTILYQRPTELLPILVLVSKERGTGKSTFLALLKEIFANNMTYNTNEDFRSNFNDSWVYRLIIAIDEVLLGRREDSEKLKNLSTATKYKIESKGVDRVEVEFFGKFILCSNNEDDLIGIDPLETRYWVRKIQPLENVDPNFFKKMKEEVPAFVHFLSIRKITQKKESRMWFTPEQLVTDSLLKIKKRFRDNNEAELLGIIAEIMDGYNLNDFNFTNKDAIELLRSNNIKVNSGEIRRVIERWRIPVSSNSNMYTSYRYNENGIVFESRVKGRFYTIRRSDIDRISMI